MLATNIGIDLGTSSVLVYIRRKGIVLREPSVVVVNTQEDNQVVAVGEEAQRMIGRTPQFLKTIRPLRDGVISDFEYTEKMLQYFVERAIGRRFLKSVIAVCVPSGVTEVEKRAVMDVAYHAGAGKVYVIEEPLAAAIGAGVDMTKAAGSLIVDIGGGTTDVAIVSLGGVVLSKSIKVAGDVFDEALIRYIRQRYNLLIGERTAEEIKIKIGEAYHAEGDHFMEAKGRDLVTGLPSTVKVTSQDTLEAFKEPLSSILDTIHSVLEKTPPELAADIMDRGIIMTGGGSMLHGIDRLIQENMGIDTFVAEDAISCVASGTGKYLDYITQTN